MYHPPDKGGFVVYMYVDDACMRASMQRPDNAISTIEIKRQIERIYNNQGITMRVHILTDRNDAKDMYTAWQQGRMPPNIQVFNITHDTKNPSDEIEAGAYSYHYRIHYVNFYRLLHNFPFLDRNGNGVTRSYQVAHTAAHEMLHNMLHEMQHFYGIAEEFDNTFHIDHTDHSLEDEYYGPNLNTCGNIPTLYDADEERILPEQLFAIQTMIEDIYDADADIEASRERILAYAKRTIEARRANA